MFECFKDKKFLKTFIKISVPVIAASFITLLVNLIDNIMVGTVSNNAVSSVYAANQVTYIYNMAVFGILEGAGVFIQQYNGAKDNFHIRSCYKYKLIIVTLLMIISLPLILLFGKDMIYAFCNKDSEALSILNEGTIYLNIVTIGFIPYAYSFALNSTLKEIGETRVPLYSSIIALFSNIIFNSIFILVLDMGTVGAAIATNISRFLEFGFTLLMSYKFKVEFLNKEYKNIKIEKELIKGINKKSIYLFINEMGFAIGMLLQNLAFSQRDGVLSSISIQSTVINIVITFVSGFSIGVGVMIGSKLGNNEFDEARADSRKMMYLGAYVSLALSIILAITSPFVPNIFKEVTIEQKQLATKLLLIYSLVLIFMFESIISYYTLRAGGRIIETFIFDSGMMFTLYIPISWILSAFTNLDLVYIFLIVRSLDIIKGILGIILLKQNKWVKNITIFKNREE